MDSNRLALDRVDQLFTGYSSSGMRALDSTFGDAELNRQWEQTLIHYVRLESFGLDNPPPVAFTYIAFDHGSAALLRRVESGDSSGRNNAHVLIGRADILGAVALDLTEWDRWLSDLAGTKLQPLTSRDLRVAQNAVDVLDDRANVCGDLAVPLMSCVLQRPQVKLSSIAMEQGRIIPTLRLLERVLKPLFRLDDRTRNWSFSTHELTDADHGNRSQPELIFLPKLPNHAGEISYQRVFFDEANWIENKYYELAHDLIEEYFRLGVEGYHEKIAGDVGPIRTVELRIGHLLSAGLRRRQQVSSSTPTGPPGLTLASSAGSSAERSWQEVSGESKYSHRPSKSSATFDPLSAVPPITSAGEVSEDEEIVRQIAKARGDGNIDYWLTALVERIIQDPVTDDYRWGLISRYDILRVLARNLCLWDLMIAYGYVLEFAFGAGAKVLYRQRFFSQIEGAIKNPKISPLFGCMVYCFVKGSIMESRCTQLLEQRACLENRISLLPTSRSRFIAGQSGWLAPFSHNRQVLILLALIILFAIIVIIMILLAWG